ncbi:MAG: polyribonucleotide nucleotidyltransferase [Parcubacteria group bacterium CG_4_9_14_0_2_um_filter_35_11]|nr:MAG: polyribonucleotide nucleotidyltransferase [Parcubacteria group bacterium CG_4_9_14_0_2_um_filter_35_11]
MLYQTEFAKRPLKIETNSLASQASGSVLVSFGNTVVLGTATMGETDIETDFLPLTVDYEERFYASGAIKGSRYIRREGRPTEEAILVSRMIDRAIRPYFPQNLKKEVQVILTVFAFDEKNDPDFPALLAASLALSLSDIPWEGPVTGVRIGKKGDEKGFILNPTYEERKEAKLDIFVSGIDDKNGEILINMLEGYSKEVEEDEILSAINFSRELIKILLNLQKNIQKKEGKIKPTLKIEEENIRTLYKNNSKKIKNALLLAKEEEGKLKSFSAQEKLIEELGIDRFTFSLLVNKILHEIVLKEGIRPDGRKTDELRKINCKVGILPQTHGSALFCRGLTHVLSILTLGAPGDELIIEGMELVGKKRFLHHYNFPPYSAGEVRPLRGPGRREIGHGALVEKALKSLIPGKEDFPYTSRIVSEVLSSNGSTSMAAVCASSLALFDAGVKIKRHVAGISCGLIIEEDEQKLIKDRNFKILTDIQGPEDSHGDMDLKVAGTKKGVTAIQLDVKTKGLTIEILKEGSLAARKARQDILEKMEKTLPQPRQELSPYAPKILTHRIEQEKIREIIGPGGKTINKIIAETDTTIDIEEDGLIYVTSKDKEKAEKAIEWIKNITREIRVGEKFQGKITGITDFGLFVELLPNQDGLLHISEISPRPYSKRDLLKNYKIGQILSVKVKNITPEGKITLSLESYGRRSKSRI